MLLSTFSLSLSGLVAKYLSETMPISLLSFVRFLLPSLFLFLFLTFYKINKPTREMWKPLVMRGDLYGGLSVVFPYVIANLNACGRRCVVQYRSSVYSIVRKINIWNKNSYNDCGLFIGNLCWCSDDGRGLVSV